MGVEPNPIRLTDWGTTCQRANRMGLGGVRTETPTINKSFTTRKMNNAFWVSNDYNMHLKQGIGNEHDSIRDAFRRRGEWLDKLLSE